MSHYQVVRLDRSEDRGRIGPRSFFGRGRGVQGLKLQKAEVKKHIRAERGGFGTPS